MMDAKPDRATQLLMVILAIVGVSVAIFYRTKPAPAPLPPILVPLGTNVVARGTAFYNPANSEQGGTILESDNAYEFPDGSIKPGLLIKSKANGVEVWVPREKMSSVLVERRE